MFMEQWDNNIGDKIYTKLSESYIHNWSVTHVSDSKNQLKNNFTEIGGRF